MHFQKHKKTTLGIIITILLICWGSFAVYASAPSGGYNPGDTLDPDCAPLDTDCLVATGINIGDLVGNSPDLNGILYTDGTGNLVTDDLFLRDAATGETIIAMEYNLELPQYELTVSNVLGINNLSAPFNDGDEIEGATSGATATVEHSGNGFLYLSNLSGIFQDNEVINNITSSETANVNEVYPTTAFSVDDTFFVYDVSLQQTVGTGVVTDVSGDTYTVSPTSGTFDQYNLLVDQLGGGLTKIVAISDGVQAPSGSTTTYGEFKHGEFLGGYLLGVGSTYRNQAGNKYGVNMIGTSGTGGDSYNAITILGDTVLNNYVSMTMGLSNPSGKPELQLGVTDVINSDNSNILLTGDRMILQNNQVIALLGRVQIGSFDYNNNTELDPYPAFPNYYYLPQSRGSAGQILMDVDGDGDVTWETIGSSGITTLGSIDLQTKSDDGAVISGSTLYLQSADETHFGLVYGKTNITNTMYGYQAGFGATNLNDFYLGNGGHSVTMLGNFAGKDSNRIDGTVIVGSVAGLEAEDVQFSGFFGEGAGYNTARVKDAFFQGYFAGNGSTDIESSNFFGVYAGQDSVGVIGSNFFGRFAGYQSNASHSNFLGYYAGQNATNASNSNFFGLEAGNGAASASNATFIGQYAGYGDSVDNTANSDDFSILIGPNTSTGGFSNSIAIGSYAINTATDQFMIGSTTRPIDELVIVGNGASCAIDNNIYGDGTTGINCSSDQRLKTNVAELSPVLDTLSNIQAVNFNWIANPDGNANIGFIAQNLQEYYPELVRTGHDGYLQVNYAGITPILVKAIQEMNLKITAINDMATSNSWRDALIGWFESATNGIRSLVVQDRICISDQCLTKDDIQDLLELKNTLSSPQDDPDDNNGSDSNDGSDPSPATEPDPEPSVDPEPELQPEIEPEPAPEPDDTGTTEEQNTGEPEQGESAPESSEPTA